MKTTKPTGGGVFPPNVCHAQEIEDLICEKGATCDLDDFKFDDVEEADAHSAITVSSDDDNPPAASKPPKAAVTHAVCSEAPLCHCGASNMDIISNLANTFTPEAQQSREDEQTTCSLQNTVYGIKSTASGCQYQD